MKCKCTFAKRVLGDGCMYCNPELHEYLELQALDEVRDYYREDVYFGFLLGDEDDIVWDMVAEYFTHR